MNGADFFVLFAQQTGETVTGTGNAVYFPNGSGHEKNQINLPDYPKFGILLSALSILFGGVISGDDSCVLTICRICPIHLNLRCSSVHEKSMSSFIIKKIAKSLVESMVRKLVPCQYLKTQYAVLHDEKKYPLML